MKRILFLFCAAAIASCTGSDASTTATNPDSAKLAQAIAGAGDTAGFTVLQWIDSTFQDIGKVKKGQTAEVSWRLKNAGDKPLVIEQVSPGCGCTVAEKPEQPIMPGGEARIKGKFNSSGQHVGEHRKFMTVMANSKVSTNHQLAFRVEVTE